MDNRSNIWRGVDTIKPRFIELSDRVWAMPEVCYTEARSSAEHLAELRHQGFRITEQVAGIPTAVMGEWGEGGPVIAFLGEYDALPGLSQEADVAEPRPIEAGGHGHGCGHNLLGSAALLAATAVKDWLAAPSRLWPQPWPLPSPGSGRFSATPASWESPGSASYSPRMAITGPPSPASPITAVGMPATSLVTRKPSASSMAVCSAQERNSA